MRKKNYLDKNIGFGQSHNQRQIYIQAIETQKILKSKDENQDIRKRMRKHS